MTSLLCCCFLLWFLASDLRYLHLLVFTHLLRSSLTKFYIFGDILLYWNFLADLLCLLLTLYRCMSLSLAMVSTVPMAIVSISMLAHLHLLTILALIAGDLEKCFSFCLAGFLKLQPAEGLGHGDYLPGALVVV